MNSAFPKKIAIDRDTFLEILQEDDAGELFSLTDRNRHHLDSWLPWVKHTLHETHSLDFIRSGLHDLAVGRAFHYGLWRKRKLVGVLGAHNWRRDEGVIEVGYWLGKAAEGQGLMSRAVRRFIHEGFHGSLALNAVQICCDPRNVRSSAIPRRLGFRHIEQVQVEEDGERVVHDVYRIGRAEWS